MLNEWHVDHISSKGPVVNETEYTWKQMAIQVEIDLDGISSEIREAMRKDIERRLANMERDLCESLWGS